MAVLAASPVDPSLKARARRYKTARSCPPVQTAGMGAITDGSLAGDAYNFVALAFTRRPLSNRAYWAITPLIYRVVS
jgi:hypothetical protein